MSKTVTHTKVVTKTISTTTSVVETKEDKKKKKKTADHVTCECGASITKSGLSKHKTTDKHQLKMGVKPTYVVVLPQQPYVLLGMTSFKRSM
jgi:hypothetical protein